MKQKLFGMDWWRRQSKRRKDASNPVAGMEEARERQREIARMLNADLREAEEAKEEAEHLAEQERLRKIEEEKQRAKEVVWREYSGPQGTYWYNGTESTWVEPPGRSEHKLRNTAQIRTRM